MRADVVYVMNRREGKELYGGTRSAMDLLGAVEHAVEVVVMAPSPDDAALVELSRRGIPSQHIEVPAGVPRWKRLFDQNRLLAAHLRRIGFRGLLHLEAEAFWGGEAAAWRRRCPSLLHLRNIPSESRLSPRRRGALLAATHVAAITGDLGESYLRLLSRVERMVVGRKLSTIPNGFILSEYDAIREAGAGWEVRESLGIPDAPVIVTVGSVEPRKMQAWLLEEVAPVIADRMPNAVWLFVGGSKERSYWDECQRLAAASRLDVRFLGYQAEPRPYMLAADVVAFPSRREGLGRVAVEAQALQVPVVATDTVGLREALANGAGGFLSHSSSEFTSALLHFLESPAEARRAGAEGRAYVDRFELGRCARRLDSLYGHLLAARGRGGGLERGHD